MPASLIAIGIASHTAVQALKLAFVVVIRLGSASGRSILQ